MLTSRLGVVVLAGGQATRLPGKLELDAGGEPLIVRVFRNVAPAGAVYLSASRSFSAEIDAALACPIVMDRWPSKGPLAGLYSTMECVREDWVFVVAGDAPFVTAATAAELAAAWEPGCQAVVPLNGDGRLEPLCALYERLPFLLQAGPVLQEGSGGVRAVVERIRTKRVRLSDDRVFANVNTAADRTAILQV